ncbi:LPXTG cell wall anchor domain-containing protein [Lacticaseibacillus pabuli]|uniref:LPXTG cell wall anchor domain-containing protein n=1 Tax=Lacticaseibacillus pabuli TaxID=3025672 RepID=A0ABY7WT73_9LACO|nr:LPXTG cell wall anchor domain-containing protein [Lacticaseibacillus sp. KACC 23028]WDF82643.1 LPXTG cell wall anchor domain-containing protein [Lacticaseibacillus sp. KACC 23028]
MSAKINTTSKRLLASTLAIAALLSGTAALGANAVNAGGVVTSPDPQWVVSNDPKTGQPVRHATGDSQAGQGVSVDPGHYHANTPTGKMNVTYIDDVTGAIVGTHTYTGYEGYPVGYDNYWTPSGYSIIWGIVNPIYGGAGDGQTNAPAPDSVFYVHKNATPPTNPTNPTNPVTPTNPTTPTTPVTTPQQPAQPAKPAKPTTDTSKPVTLPDTFGGKDGKGTTKPSKQAASSKNAAQTAAVQQKTAQRVATASKTATPVAQQGTAALPQTGDNNNSLLATIGLALAGFLSVLGLYRVRQEN